MHFNFQKIIMALKFNGYKINLRLFPPLDLNLFEMSHKKLDEKKRNQLTNKFAWIKIVFDHLHKKYKAFLKRFFPNRGLLRLLLLYILNVIKLNQSFTDLASNSNESHTVISLWTFRECGLSKKRKKKSNQQPKTTNAVRVVYINVIFQLLFSFQTFT